MKPIRVLFFASLRERTGTDRIELPAAGVSDLRGLWASLDDALAADAMSALRARDVRIAVNQELIEGDVGLRPGDEVAFMPPVTGG